MAVVPAMFPHQKAWGMARERYTLTYKVHVRQPMLWCLSRNQQAPRKRAPCHAPQFQTNGRNHLVDLLHFSHLERAGTTGRLARMISVKRFAAKSATSARLLQPQGHPIKQQWTRSASDDLFQLELNTAKNSSVRCCKVDTRAFHCTFSESYMSCNFRSRTGSVRSMTLLANFKSSKSGRQ